MKLFLILLLCSYYSLGISAQNVDFPDSFRSTHFMLFYALSPGTNQLPTQNRVDKVPKNGIPDFVEAIATQLETANAFYTGSDLKLQQPLLSGRYQGKVAYYGIYIKKFNSGNGSTSDEIQEDDSDNPILKISLSNSLSSTNLTPAHELFHTFQNGYSMIKNSWFLEGSARWVENAFRDITEIDDDSYQKQLPQNNQVLEKLVGLSYSADAFWNRLTYLCDPASPPNDAKSPVRPIYGLKLMKSFLDHLLTQSDAATRDRCYSFYQWPEEDQKRNVDNNIYLFKAIQHAALSQCPAKQLQSQELKQFLQVIADQITRFDRPDAFYDSEMQRLYLPRVSVINATGTDTLLNPTETSNTFKVMLDLTPDTKPVRFTVHNATPLCNSKTQKTSAIYDSGNGLLQIPTLEFLPFGDFQIDLTKKPNSTDFDLTTFIKK